jgi:hypothetical protein
MSRDNLFPTRCPARSKGKLFIEAMKAIALIQRIIQGAGGKFA